MGGLESYRDRFEMYLTDLLRGEGYMTRRLMFEVFVRESLFFCGRCQEEFETTSANDVAEDEEVLCPRCRKKGRQ